MLIAQIAVSAAVFSIDRPYSYHTPDDSAVQAGMRVIVPFGRGNRLVEGVVLSVMEGNDPDLKSVVRSLDETPVLSEEFLRLAAFLRERYFCTFYEAVKAMLPAGLWFQTEELLTRTEKNADKARLSDLERQILSFVVECGGKVSRSQLKTQFSSDEFDAALYELSRKKYLHSDYDYAQKIHDKTAQFIRLSVSSEQANEYAETHQRSAPLQSELLRLLCAVGSGSSKELCYLTGASQATIRRLEQLGLIECYSQEVFRNSLPSYIEPAEPIVLNSEQQTAFDRLLSQSLSQKPGVGLLYGVTGSGKTSVYIQLIKEILSQGKDALYLVPEIALTPQLITLLMSHFGDTVAVLHSGLRISERYDAWKKIKKGLSHVIVGTRSAVFAPVENLGLIIVDEEQEHSYKSENAPRYHARDVSIFRGLRSKALVVLGSATPSIESMYLARTGAYSLSSLKNRYNGKSLPRVEIVDMKCEISQGNSTDISIPLRQALRKNLANEHQSILFLNKRGAGRCIICVECGTVPQCPACSVSLTYHQVNHRLMCHHCGYSQAAPDRCSACGGHVKTVGTGTQKVEQDLRALFPQTEIIRMDADTVTASNPHEAILRRFEEERIPILIGTQMVTKGLNFDGVTLVGVLDADMSLYVDHFRAAETTFSMLTQVIGRAGRGKLGGKAIVQTMTPQHTVMKLAANQDYDGFYELEYTMRQMQHTPPCSDLIKFSFMSHLEEAALAGAYGFRKLLEQLDNMFDIRILGPAPAAVLKVNHMYRYRLTVSCKNTRDLRLRLAALMKFFEKNKRYKGVSVYADVNSYE